MRADAHEIRSLFELSLDALCVAGVDGRFREVNPALARIYGRSVDELLTRPLMDFVHPDDREATSRELASLSTGAPTVSFENRVLRPDGSVRSIAWRATPVIESGLVYAVGRDVTEARRLAALSADREARMQAVVAAVTDAIVMIDERGAIEAVNPACERMFGCAAAELTGRPVSRLMPQPYRDRHQAYVERYLATGEPRIAGKGPREVTAMRPDGSTFEVELIVSDLRLSDRRLFVGVLRDISERKRAESDRAALIAQEANQRGRVEVSAGILHDLGNALTGISARATDVRATLARAQMQTDLPRTARFVRANRDALAGALGAPKADALGDILDAIAAAQADTFGAVGEGLAKLLAFVSHAQDVLAIHRVHSGVGAGPRTSKASVQGVLLDVQAMMSDAVARHGGRLTVYAEGELRGVTVDGVRVLRALINAVQNAVEAFADAPGDGPFEVSVLAALLPDGALQLCVRDNGPGFARGGEELFAEGFTTKARGSGRGLGAARDAVAPLGGAVSIASDGPGRGALFTLTLPPSRSTTP